MYRHRASGEARAPRTVRIQTERAQADAQALLLGALHLDVLRIASSGAPEDAIAQLLRAAHETLGFARGIYFSVERECGIEARWQIDGASGVRPAPPARHDRSVLSAALRGDHEPGLVWSTARAPLPDVRPPYVLSSLAYAAATFGILYVDGYAGKATPSPRFVHALTEAAALSIGNSMRLARANELASRDALTGLFNRRALDDRLSRELRACRELRRSLAFVMIDVDDLKRINDTHGHAAGDEVLRGVAGTLTRVTRAGDVAARFGGDEFALVLPNVRDDRAAELVARLSNELRAAGLSCSIGAAHFPRDAADEMRLLCAADRALYASKAAGKNGFVLA